MEVKLPSAPSILLAGLTTAYFSPTISEDKATERDIGMDELEFKIIAGSTFNWSCGKCTGSREAVTYAQGSIFVEVYVDGKPYTLAADKPAVCPRCRDVKDGRTPAVFATLQKAREKIRFLEARIAEGKGDFCIPLLNREPLGPF